MEKLYVSITIQVRLLEAQRVRNILENVSAAFGKQYWMAH